MGRLLAAALLALALPAAAQVVAPVRPSAVSSSGSSSKRLTVANGIKVTDTATASAALLEVEHRGAVGGGAYGIDVKSLADNSGAPTAGAGAGSPIVVHQYSDAGPAVQIDGVRSKALLKLRNASNGAYSAGTYGTGSFLDLYGYSTSNAYPANPNPVQLAVLDQFLTFRTYDVSRPFIFASSTSAESLRVDQSNAGIGLKINQTGAGSALWISHGGATHGVQIVPTAGADGWYPILVSGRRHGGAFSTSQDNGSSLIVEKTATGPGDTLVVINKGTGLSLRVKDATAVDVFRVTAIGEPELVANGAGALLRSPNGTRYRLTVSDAGAVVVTAAP